MDGGGCSENRTAIAPRRMEQSFHLPRAGAERPALRVPPPLAAEFPYPLHPCNLVPQGTHVRCASIAVKTLHSIPHEALGYFWGDGLRAGRKTDSPKTA